MDAQEREASNVIAQWQESYSAVEARCNELQNRVAELESSNNSIDTKQTEGGDDNREATRIAELQQLMDEKDRQATEVVSQWQASYEFLKNENAELLSRLGEQTTLASQSTEANTGTGESQVAEIASLNVKIEELESNLQRANENCSKFEAEYNTSLNEKRALEAQLSTMSQEYDTMVGQDEEHRRKLSSLERKTTELETLLRTSNELVEKHSARVRDLEAELETKTAELVGEESEANQVIQEWQDSYNELQDEKTEVENKLQALTSEHDTTLVEREKYHSRVLELEAKLQHAEMEKAGFESQLPRTALLESKLQEKEQQLEALSQRDREVEVEWHERNKALENELESVKSRMESVVVALEEARVKKEEDRVKIIELESHLKEVESDRAKLTEATERITELENDLRTTAKQFSADSQEADEIIEQWKESHDALESEKADLENRLEKLETAHGEVIASRDEYVAIADQLQADLLEAQRLANVDQLTKLQGEKATLEGQVATLSKEKEEIKTVSAAKERGFEEKISELEKEVRIRTEEVEKDAADADDVIGQWQESYNMVVAEKADAETLVEQMSKKLDDLQTRHDGSVNEIVTQKEMITSLKKEHEEAKTLSAAKERGFEEKIRELEKEIRIRTEEVEKDAEDADDVIRQWQESYDMVVAEKVEAETRVEQMSKKLEDLQTRHDGSVNEIATQKEMIISLKKEHEEAKTQSAAKERGFEEKIRELQEEIRIRTEEVEKDAKDADDVVRQWQESYDMVVAEKAEAETRVEQMSKKLEDLQTRHDGSMNEIVTHKEMITSLKKEHEEAKTRSATRERDIEERIRELEEELGIMVDEAKTDTDDADNAIQQWEESYEAVVAEKTEAESRFESLSTKLEDVQAKHAECLNELSTQKELLTSLTKEKDEVMSRSSARERVIQKRISELEEELGIKTAQVEKDAKDADEAVRQWQQSYEVVVAEKAEAESRLESFSKKCEEVQAKHDECLNELAAQKELLASTTAQKDEIVIQSALQDRISELEEELLIKTDGVKMDAENADAIRHWQEKYEVVVADKAEADSRLESQSKKIETITAKHDECLKEVAAQKQLLEEKHADWVKTKEHLDEVESELEHLNKIESELKQTEEQLAASITATKELAEKLEKSENLSSHLESQLGNAVRERGELILSETDHHAETERLQSELDEAKQSAAHAHGQITELQERLSTADTRLEEHANTNRELQAKCHSLEELSSKLASSLDTARTESMNYEQDLKNQVEKLEEALAAEVEQADEAIQQWQDSYDVLLAEKEDIETQFTALNEIKECESEGEAKNTMKAQLEEAKHLLQMRDDEHQELLRSYEATLQLYDEEKASKEEELKLLRLKASRFEEECRNATANLRLLSSTKQTVEEELRAVTRGLEESRRELERAQRGTIIGEMERALVDHDTIMKDNTEHTDNLEGELQLNTSESAFDDSVRETEPFEIAGSTRNTNYTPPPTTISVNLRAELEFEREARKNAEDRCMKLELENEEQKTESKRIIRSWRGTSTSSQLL